MSGYGFLRDGDAALPEVWRALDRALWHWVGVHGGSPALALAAGWASHADGLGDTALPLLGEDAGRHGMAAPDAAEVAALRDEVLVGDGSEVTPFVLDAAGRFSLWRNHAHEVAIAAQVAARRRNPQPPDAARLAADLDLLYAAADPALQRQREAVASAAGKRLFVLTGGPGTGKTTTVLRLLLMLQRQAAVAPAIALAAPTGKAAQRLLQALRDGKQPLCTGAQALPADWQPLLAQIPEHEAPTLHWLLGYDPYRNRFTRGLHRPLAADIVVVDEASMLDLAMLRALLEALREDACLILVGDADQLSSVAAGSVFMDLVFALEQAGGSDLVRLEHSFRAGHALVPVNRAVRSGDLPALQAALDPVRGLHRRSVADAASLRQAMREWAADLAGLALRPLLPPNTPASVADAVPAPAAGRSRRGRAAATPESAPQQASLWPAQAPDAAVLALQALRVLASCQLLCALREDTFGALALNALIEAELKQHWGVPAEALWYPGRAVVVTRNDYAAGLFNGDTGLCLADADGRLRVWFESTRADGEAGARALPPDGLPAHEGGFALTVHKSQGSEYGRVAVLLPPDPAHRILSRQLLYTAVSRARQALELWALPEVLAAALARPVRRTGGLVDKLQTRFLDP